MAARRLSQRKNQVTRFTILGFSLLLTASLVNTALRGLNNQRDLLSSGDQQRGGEEALRGTFRQVLFQATKNSAAEAQIVSERNDAIIDPQVKKVVADKRGLPSVSVAGEEDRRPLPESSAFSPPSRETIIVEGKASEGERGGQGDGSAGGGEKNGGLVKEQSEAGADSRGRDELVHVFVSTDEVDLRPIAVVLNSTITNARHPDRLRFHLIVPPGEHATTTKAKLSKVFPTISLDVNREVVDLEAIAKRITFREGSGTRRELVSPFNFVPFYLPQLFPDIRRIIYIDADVVVEGDIEDIARVDMEGKPAAAVEDCMQTIGMYFDFAQLASIRDRAIRVASRSFKDSESKPSAQLEVVPKKPFDPKACVFNRGVLLIDVRKWEEMKITQVIEWWMEEFRKGQNALYRYGLSQPPFLLALYQRYRKLDVSWNTRGLGRDKLSEVERDFLAKRPGAGGRPAKSPFVCPWADRARILHFNGKFKPWRGPRQRPPGERPPALCGKAKTDCAELWWKYLSVEGEKRLGAQSRRLHSF